MATLEERVIDSFCARYEGKEEELSALPLVYSDILSIAGEHEITPQKVAEIILQAWDS